jgi:hypothetical protein
MGFGEPAQAGEETDSCTSCCFQGGGAPPEQDAEEFTVPEQLVEFVG